MKICVIAGTKVDTKMGADLIEERGFEAIPRPISENPKDQTELQYFSKGKLEDLFKKNIENAKEKGAEKVFLYCNSLSSSVDYKKIENEMNIPIITPLETYKNIDEDIKNLAILAANGISAYKIDKIITKYNPHINTISIGNLSIVKAIEEKKSPEKIIDELNLIGLIDYFSGIKDDRYKIDAIVLGCTHFPYLKSELEKLTTIKIIDPAEDMLKRIEA